MQLRLSLLRLINSKSNKQEHVFPKDTLINHILAQMVDGEVFILDYINLLQLTQSVARMESSKQQFTYCYSVKFVYTS